MNEPPSLTWYLGRSGSIPWVAELLERRVHVVDGDRDVAVGGAELIRVDAEVVRQLEPLAVAGQAHEDVDRLLADRKPPALLEAERVVEGDRAIDVGDPVAGVDELHACSPPLSWRFRRKSMRLA